MLLIIIFSLPVNCIHVLSVKSVQAEERCLSTDQCTNDGGGGGVEFLNDDRMVVDSEEQGKNELERWQYVVSLSPVSWGSVMSTVCHEERILSTQWKFQQKSIGSVLPKNTYSILWASPWKYIGLQYVYLSFNLIWLALRCWHMQRV